MPRFRLSPTLAQQMVLLEHCRHARFVWNLAVEQHGFWQPGLHAPGDNEQCAQLTAIRAEYAWLAVGSQTVQQQALRDFARAMQSFFAGVNRHPTWRKAGVHEGFRQVGLRPHHVRKLNKRYGLVWVPRIGWIRFRGTRAVPADVKSYRITHDRSGRWHVAFTQIPQSIPGPMDGTVVGVDRGVAVSAALSTGELLHAPSLTPGEEIRLRRLQQHLARAKRGSNRRGRVELAIAKLKAREGDRRNDWAEKVTTDLARRFDTIRVEQFDVRAMTRSARGTVDKPGVQVAQKRGLNRAINQQAWGRIVVRLDYKAAGRLERVPAAYTSQPMRRLRARRARKPQEPSGIRVRRLQGGAVQRRCQRCPQHRRRTGGTSTGRPRRRAVCEL
ncbi:RNA-guided endonuclease InsQ/TnpB family protein [Candidatus Mycobacterium methanotrophicum]|uniref:RNA-guided endonuclease InsQ/TnpB family protein n=1 Tax=Candidatus Mycobacterium methanotrophicum TaxID=2943498 RepID=UPI003F7FBDC4